MRKTLLFGIVFLLLAVGTLGVPPVQTTTQTQTDGLIILYPKVDVLKYESVSKMHFHILNATNGYPVNITKVNCSFHLYNSSDRHILDVSRVSVDSNLLEFSQNINTTTLGRFHYNVWCFDNSVGGYASGFFDVTPYGVNKNGNDNVLFSALALIPIILTIILLVGAVSLGEEHNALKIGLFLLSPVTLIISLNIGMITLVEFYNFPELQDVIGTTLYWITLVWVTIIVYFIIYLIYKAVHTAAQKKKERLEY